MADIFGTPGNDTLTGGSSGSDRLFGGQGDDTYIVDADDAVIELDGEGQDTIGARSSYQIAAGSFVEVLATTNEAGTGAFTLIGNELAQTIYGNAGNNTLIGLGGVDVLVGGLGDDTYVVDADDIILEGANGGALDTVASHGSYQLNAGWSIEVLATTNEAGTGAFTLIGNELAQTIYGNAGDNTLIGLGGIDVLVGGLGDDTYVVDADDIIIEGANGGNLDTVASHGSYQLNAGWSIEVLATTNEAGTGAFTLIGNELAQTIYGNAGHNTLIGLGGIDVLVGGLGDDTYVVDADDIIIEGANGGNLDTVASHGSYQLNAGWSIEVLATTNEIGTGAFTLIGNELNQTIYGNWGNNVLNGLGGADLLVGLKGDDTYIVDSLDIVIENPDGGFDVVSSSGDHALFAGSYVEVLATTDEAGTGAFSLTGNELAQTIYGNAGNNAIDGKGGNDTLIGLAGADTYAFTTALGAGNVDTIIGFSAGTDKIRLGGNAGEPFAALASGLLASGAFVIGGAALEADDYLIYDSTTGALLYDADGNGGAVQAVQFATLGTGLSLTAADFVVSGPANSAPVITSPTVVSVTENSPVTAVVYQAAATDADGDRILYSLGGQDAGLFTIDVLTGAVKLISPADYETRTSYNFSVIAADSGPTAGVQQVRLDVIDVADAVTPVIAEQENNDNSGLSQIISRSLFAIAPNPNLPDDDLPSVRIDGVLPTSSDEDWFRVELQAGELIIIDVDNSGGNLDAFVRLFSANQTAELISNDDLGALDPGSEPHPDYGHNTDSYIRFRVPSTGTYYIAMGSFQDPAHPTSGSYQLNISIGPPATPAQIIEEDIDALVSGLMWQTHNLTYGFPTLASQYPAGIKETDDGGPPNFNEPDNFEPFNATQQAVVNLQLGMISQVTPLLFSLNAANPGGTHLRFAMSDEAEVAYAYYPPANGNPGGLGGSAWFNNSGGDFDNPVLGNYAWMGILHETGHALGLKHGHEAPAIQPDRDSVEYTVMTYRSYPGDPLTGGYSNETWGYPQSLMMYDIAALQRIYGANFNTNSGNTVYSWSPTTGQMSIDGVGQGTPGANRVFMTVWDGGGNDTYDLSAYTSTVTIDLRPGEWSRTSTTQLANLGDGHSARGNVANALLYQDDPRSLIENAIGGSGSDFIIANQAANQLTGNADRDTFRWVSAAHSSVGALADTVTDFHSNEVDLIDLTTIDANPATGADDAFTFLGTAAFTNTPGQVRYDVIGGHAHIFADLDGNGVAEMEIILNNVTFLGGADFNL